MDNPNLVAQLQYGNISAAVWKNETDSGSFLNVTIKRTYKEVPALKNMQSFGSDDLLPISKLAHPTHTKIFDLQHGDNR